MRWNCTTLYWHFVQKILIKEHLKHPSFETLTFLFLQRYKLSWSHQRICFLWLVFLWSKRDHLKDYIVGLNFCFLNVLSASQQQKWGTNEWDECKLCRNLESRKEMIWRPASMQSRTQKISPGTSRSYLYKLRIIEFYEACDVVQEHTTQTRKLYITYIFTRYIGLFTSS